MTIFVLAGGLLAIAALAWVLHPLWRQRPVVGAAAVSLLVLTSAVLYLAVGTPAALQTASLRPPETLAEAIVQLETELERNPAPVEGWRLLGRAYLADDRPQEAAMAYARALELAPDEPVLLTEAAELRARTAPDRRFDDEAVAMLERALEQDPSQQRARWFLGIALRQAGDAAGAAETWEPLLAQVDPGTASNLRIQIDQARADAGLEPLPPPEEPAEAAGAIRISVSVDPGLALQVPPDASLFLIARRPGGPPMPVAVQKRPLEVFPIQATLTDADSLMPTATLSSLEQVELVARISASGEATPRPGDLESAPVVVEAGPGAVAALLIDQVVR